MQGEFPKVFEKKRAIGGEETGAPWSAGQGGRRSPWECVACSVLRVGGEGRSVGGAFEGEVGGAEPAAGGVEDLDEGVDERVDEERFDALL